MDILFVDAFQQSSVTNLSIGMQILSTIIRKNTDYKCEVISFPNLLAKGIVPSNILLEKNYETITTYILAKKPKIVSFYTIGSSFFISLIVARSIKEIDDNIKIVFAGPHVSLCSYETLKAYDFIDMVAIGEGENNIIDIINFFNHKERINNIKGVCYKKNNQIIYNAPSPMIEELDNLPLLELEMDQLPSIIPIETGRGCPFNCTFCCTKSFWKRSVRLKTPDRIIQEIKYYMQEYNVKKFDFIHDLFTVSKKNIMDFCNKIIDEELGIQWSCSARVDTLDSEMLTSMVRAGCKKILLGIETGSQRMQQVINKNLDISQVRDTIMLIASNNIEMQINFIFGFPEEDEEDLDKSLKLIRYCVEEMQIKETTVHKCMCFPSTQLFMNERNNLILDENNLYLFRHPAKQHINFLKSYPELFSCLYITNSYLVSKYFYLDIFINYVYNYFTLSIPKTISEILKSYNNSLLEFYKDYAYEMNRFATLLTETIYSDVELNDVRDVMTKSLEIFIGEKIPDDFVLELFRFEEEIIRTALRSKSDLSKIQIFDYDMLLYYQKNKRKKEKCKLMFIATDGHEVDIHKVM